MLYFYAVLPHPASMCAGTAFRGHPSALFSLVACLLLASIHPVCHSASAMGADTQSIELLSQGDFGRKAERWHLQSDAPASAKQQILDTQVGPAGAGSHVMHIDIASVGEQSWKVQLYQGALDLEDDKPYTLSFWARADRERAMGLNMAIDAPDWHTVGLNVARVPLTRDWHKFSYVFTATRTAREHNRLAFVLGDTPGMVEIARVSLVNNVPAPPTGPNLLESASIVTDTQEWSLSCGGAAKATLNWVDAPSDVTGITGKVAQLAVTVPGDNRFNVQFQQSGLDLLERQPYTLTFWARSDQERTLGVSLGLDMPDWHSVGLDYEARVGPMWRQYSVAFTATNTIKDHGRLAFVLGDATGGVELADEQLQRNMPPEQKSPSGMAHPLIGTWGNRSGNPANQVRLTFNADGTGSVHRGEVSPTPAPTAPVQAFHWYLKDGGKNLVAGSKPYGWSIRGSGKNEALALIDTRGQTHLFYRQ
jgi:hypothetical protein